MLEKHVRRKSPVPTTSIDFLRGVAALYVVINHVRGNFFAGGRAMIAAGHNDIFDKIAIYLLSLTGLGAEFVILFFILSGFAMAHSVQNTDSLSAFFGKRTIRVWLPYIAAVLTAAAICAAIGMNSPFYPLLSCKEKLCTLSGLSRVLFYISPSTEITPQFWSLPYEIIFYCIAPFILKNGRRIICYSLAAMSGTVVSILYFGITFNPSELIPINFFLQEWLLFQIGALAYLLFDKIPSLHERWLWRIIWAGTILLILIKNYSGQTTLVTNAVMVIMTIIALKNLPDRFGVSRFNLGRFSYSIYIFHFSMIILIRYFLWMILGVSQSDMTSYFIWMGILPIVLTYCLIMWWFFERPTLIWLARVRRRHSRPAAGLL